jgi:SAM-dependent methyltransferase
MSESSYYRDHWLTVEPERLAAYEELFRWRPQQEPLLAPAQLAPGQRVADYGCGPGHLAVELARRVGPGGHVHALDLNAEFVRRTRARAEAEGVADRLTVHPITSDGIPSLPALDRIVCKNVLEYVDDPGETLASFRAALRPGGLAHVIDSDWARRGRAARPRTHGRAVRGGAARLSHAADRTAAAPAVPARGLLRRGGPGARQPGPEGHMAPVVWNMVQYARASGTLAPARLDAIVADVKRAIEAGEFLLLLPQFLVTGAAPGEGPS